MISKFAKKTDEKLVKIGKKFPYYHVNDRFSRIKGSQYF